MKQVIYDKTGRVKVTDVPAPEITDNEVLVKNAFSVVSAGTEKSMLNLMKKPLWKMAIDRPDLAKQVVDFAKGSGVKKTMDLVKSRLDVWHLLGYSSSGTIVKAGKNVKNMGIGDRVACIGSGFANHAEYVAVPKTLVTKLPKGVDLKDASIGGIGAIALQSIRQLNPQIGENVVVVGLGLIGQMVAQMLRANGCKVIGIDIDKKKTNRKYIDEPITSDTIRSVMKVTDGVGADGIIIAAATKSNLINDAFDMCRIKGRVVLLGVTGMELDREKMFNKELELKISTGFGAGAIDEIYQTGKDYPIEYARWTAERNLKAVMDLLDTKKLVVDNLIDETFDIKDAVNAYKKIEDGTITTGLFEYNPGEPEQTIEVTKDFRKAKINVGIIGAGQFVKGFIIPALKKIKAYSIYAIATKKGSNTAKLAKEIGAKYASTNYQDLLADKNIDLIIIGTRHDTHARIALEALKAGKHVFSEKPMAIKENEFKALAKEIRESKQLYTCGFNRRYSLAFRNIKSRLNDKPMMINYVFNNTQLPEDHWVNTEQGGGRVIGEACHIIDLFGYLTGSKPVNLEARKISGPANDDNNIVAILKYEDGSVCSLTYSCIGNSGAERERCTIIQDGNVYDMDGFGKVAMNSKSIYSGKANEGHDEEMRELANRLSGIDNELATGEDCITVTNTTLNIMKAIKGQK